uniref:partitioning defective 3 homolog isoform X2 n=1 Tax=Myxine glutinosa TaxID=7769 RepID=UPI00358F8C81
MKVVVCFGSTNVLIPCGDGNLQVREVLCLAGERYRKAAYKGPEWQLSLLHLEHRDGGILDGDDLVKDVCDDKDWLRAITHEKQPLVDGTAEDFNGMHFHDSAEMLGSDGETKPGIGDQATSTEIEVTPSALRSTTPLHVRRSSDPALALAFPILPSTGNTSWARATSIPPEQPMPQNQDLGNKEQVSPSANQMPFQELNSEISNGIALRQEHFFREGPRASLGTTHPLVESWLERQEREAEEMEEMHHHGQWSDIHGADELTSPALSQSSETQEVEIVNDGRLLGIHVVPFLGQTDRMLGLRIRTVEDGSKTQQEGFLQENDCITSINSTPLCHKSFEEAQQTFRQGLAGKVLHLTVVPAEKREIYEKTLQMKVDDRTEVNRWIDSHQVQPSSSRIPPPVAPKPSLRLLDEALGRPAISFSGSSHQISSLSSASSVPAQISSAAPVPVPIQFLGPPQGTETVLNPVRPHVSPMPRVESKVVPMDYGSAQSAALTSGSYTLKKVERKVNIHLEKGSDGLGFTVATRDTPVGKRSPIYVKSIMARGAAAQDGRLRSGDRLLKVNEADVTGWSQEAVVGLLRRTPLGGSVELLLSRQEDAPITADGLATVPQVLSAHGTQHDRDREVVEVRENRVADEVDKEEEEGRLLSPDGSREFLTFNVPLNAAGAAGLGVSVKGNKAKRGAGDLGIFIKSVITGGAAAKDGRLRVDDQLIAMNGESLLGKSNLEAMEALRKALANDDTHTKSLQLVVARSIQAEAMELNEEPQERRVSNTVSPPPATANTQHIPKFPPTSTALVNGVASGDANEGTLNTPTTSATRNWQQEEEHASGASHLSSAATDKAGPAILEIEAIGSGFLRDGFARQSMSEKRGRKPGDSELVKAKSMDMLAGAANFHDDYRRGVPEVNVGPSLGLAKSSSLESLQTAVAAEADNRAVSITTAPIVVPTRPRTRLVRGRGCNASFRAAIDKSYEGPAGMIANDNEEVDEGMNTRPIIPLSVPVDEDDELGFGIYSTVDHSPPLVQKTIGGHAVAEEGGEGRDMNKENKKDKKDKLKGLFRFGKMKKEERHEDKPKVDKNLMEEEERQKRKAEQERLQAREREHRERQVKLQQERERLAGKERNRVAGQDRGKASTQERRRLAGRADASTSATTQTGDGVPIYATVKRSPLHENDEDIRALYAQVNKAGTLPWPSSDRNASRERPKMHRNARDREASGSAIGDLPADNELYSRIVNTSSLPRPDRNPNDYEWVRRNIAGNGRDPPDRKRPVLPVDHSRSQSASEVRAGWPLSRVRESGPARALPVGHNRTTRSSASASRTPGKSLRSAERRDVGHGISHPQGRAPPPSTAVPGPRRSLPGPASRHRPAHGPNRPAEPPPAPPSRIPRFPAAPNMSGPTRSRSLPKRRGFHWGQTAAV